MYFPVCLSDYVFEFVRALHECVCASVRVYARVRLVYWPQPLFLYGRLFICLCVSVCLFVSLSVGKSIDLNFSDKKKWLSPQSSLRPLKLSNRENNYKLFCNRSVIITVKSLNCFQFSNWTLYIWNYCNNLSQICCCFIQVNLLFVITSYLITLYICLLN